MDGSLKSHEIRFGAVMYGGVSLAIYINGVSQELFRAVQGEGIYKLLKLCFDTDMVVDIVSGTSAGGINGLMLGYALANRSDFRRTKDLWRSSGDLGRLMYGANTDPSSCKSLLDSDDYYRDQLARAFAGLDGSSFVFSGCEPSPIDEMDVFITGTTFQPQPFTTFDDAGRPIDMLDFRKVFRLKYRPGRENPGPFRPATADKPACFQAMAKLARITSCFPGAFLPVRVLVAGDRVALPPEQKPSKLFQYEAKVDDLLCEWGKLEQSTYFLDGGLLDNKPFTPTIDAIFNRTADRPVTRILFYVEPDPETAPDGRALVEPNFVSAVRNGVLSISTYQSTTDDAKALEEHNSQVVRHLEVRGKLRGKLVSVPGSGVGVPPGLRDPYLSLYRGARNNQLVTRMLRGALRDGKTGLERRMTSASERAQVKKLFESLNQERTEGELTYDETFRRYDIFFRQRRLHHAVKWLFDGICRPAKSEAAMQSATWLLAGLNRHVQLMEILEYWFEKALQRVEVPWTKPDATENLCKDADSLTSDEELEPIWRRVSNSLRAMLAMPGEENDWMPASMPGDKDWLNASELDRINAEFKRRSGTPNTDLDAPVPGGDFDGVLQWTDLLEEQLIAARNDGSELVEGAVAEYRSYASLDAVLFPLDYLSNLNSFDEVRLLRISPAPTLDEEQRGCIGFNPNLGAEGKLAGRLLGHFSAFLKRSWRSNDILWGRLDGLRHIVLSVVTSERIIELRKNQALCGSILERLGEGGLLELVAGAFPQSPAESHSRVVEFFEKMLGAAEFVLTPGALLEIQDLLVQMGQLEVIAEELPVVLQDAAQQQNEWNRYGARVQMPAGGEGSAAGRAGRAAKAAAERARFVSPAGYLDPAVVGLTIQNEIQRFKDSWKPGVAQAKSPRETRLGHYFENEYRVATEGLERGIPPLVLAEYMTRISLVLNACLLGSLPSATRERITGMMLYKRGLRMPLRLSHGMVRLWRGEPSMTVIALTALLGACLASIVLEVYLLFGEPSKLVDAGLGIGLLAMLGLCAALLTTRRRLGL